MVGIAPIIAAAVLGLAHLPPGPHSGNDEAADRAVDADESFCVAIWRKRDTGAKQAPRSAPQPPAGRPGVSLGPVGDSVIIRGCPCARQGSCERWEFFRCACDLDGSTVVVWQDRCSRAIKPRRASRICGLSF